MEDKVKDYMSNKAVIYARVSSTGDRQDTARQVADLKAYAQTSGLEVVKVFEEKASGAKRDREILAECMDFMTIGDARHLLVSELSRLGRSVRQVLDIVEDLTDIGVNIHILQQHCCTIKEDGTQDPMVKAMVTMYGTFAEMERAAIVDRLQSGRKLAKAEGKVKFGRPEGSVMTSEEILAKYPNIVRRLKKGDRIRDIAELEHISTKTVQKVKNAMGYSTKIDSRGGHKDIAWNRIIESKDER